jgi:hypothetical protein
LSDDPRAPVALLDFPPIDSAPDNTEVYSDLSPIERARIDAQFRPPETRQRPTPDSMDLARVLEASSRNTA